jgi:hypothetical protein
LVESGHSRLPAPEEEALLEAAMVASVDHGPQAPVHRRRPHDRDLWRGDQQCHASGVNALGDAHGAIRCSRSSTKPSRMASSRDERRRRHRGDLR